VDPEPVAEGHDRPKRQDRWRLHGPRLLLGVGLALLTYALFPETPATQIPVYEMGAVATDNVIAPFAFDVPKSEDELQRERDDIVRAIEPNFRHVPEGLDTTRALLKGFESAVASAATPPGNVAAIVQAAGRSGVSLTPDEAVYLSSADRRSSAGSRAG
jgi:hypothetical protein